MSRPLHVFLASDQPLDEAAREVGRVLDCEVHRHSDGLETWYELTLTGETVTLGAHDFEDDAELRFSAFRYDIAVDRSDALARRIYEHLRAAGCWRLMLTENLQHKLEEFIPQGSSDAA